MTTLTRPPTVTTEIDEVVDHTPPSPVLDLVVPVYDEERALAPCIHELVERLVTLPVSYRVTIADNASTDATWTIATRLAHTVPGIRAVHLPAKGRGRALRAVWTSTDATVVAYTDVDLSTDLDALLPLIAPLITGHSDVSIGTRLGTGARVSRGPKREFISRSYNRIIRTAMRARFTDAQCGFKAVRADVARALLPAVENDNWFFDTELLLLAERNGLRIHEVPVDWIDDPDSRVDIVATAMEDLRGLARVWRRILDGSFRVRDIPLHHPATTAGDTRLAAQLVRFAMVGALTSLLHLGGFLTTRALLGAQLANAVALGAATLVNTALNRRFTFGVVGRQGLARDHIESAGVFAGALALTSAGLGIVGHFWPAAPATALLATLLVANATATLARFLFLRGWVFNPRRRADRAPEVH